MAFSHVYTGAAAVLVLLFVTRKLVAFLAVRRFKRAHGCKPAPKLPQADGPLGIGLFRNQIRVAKEKKVLETVLERFERCGPTWTSSVLGTTFYNTMDPENIKALLATNFKDFGLGSRQDDFGVLLGAGIFTSDGPAWEHSRAIVRPNFTRAQVADLDMFETHIGHLMSKIPRDGSTVDLQTLFFQLTLDSGTEFLLGESVNSLLCPAGSPQLRFGEAFDVAPAELRSRSNLKLLSYLKDDSEVRLACKDVHDFVDKIVYKALKETAQYNLEKDTDGEKGPQRYVFLTEMVKSTRDPKQLRDETLNLLLAGRDTTSSLLSHTFHVLARRPDILQKLQAEIGELDGMKLDFETIKSLKYLRYVITESLRLYPVVAGNGRFANKDTTIPRGGGPDGRSPVYIPKGAIVNYSVYAMQRRKDIYGPDADVFRPERWAPEEALRPGWGYLPFNGGPRICVGQQFALTEASYAIVRLLQEFKGIENRDHTPWTEQLVLTLAVGNGVKVAMIPR